MRIPSIAVACTALALNACASRPAPVSTSPLSQCPYNVLVTVSNPQSVSYDVYYLDAARATSMLGEVSAGSTVTFTLPGEGRGRVFLRRPQADGGGMPQASRGEVRIRVHCA